LLIFVELNPYFGTMKDLQDLSLALHQRGMYLMVDVVGVVAIIDNSNADSKVANHLGAEADESKFFPGAHYGPFTDPSDFHPRCYPASWEDQREIENCT
jgi:alpha-amylase